MKYGIIYADPPWSYNDPSLNRGGALRHYQTMPVEEIAALPVQKLAADNCVLLMWATFPKLQEALDVIRGWGFQYKTCAFVWIKTNRRTNPKQQSFLPSDSFDSFTGMGRWTRSNAEICLLATRGKPQRARGGGGCSSGHLFAGWKSQRQARRDEGAYCAARRRCSAGRALCAIPSGWLGRVGERG